MKLPVNYEDIDIYKRKLVREEYARLQNHLCYYCKESLYDEPESVMVQYVVNENLFPKNFFNWPIHLHHDRKTGMTIGAVHCYCNAVLWQYHHK